MNFFGELINILDAEMETPVPYGWFHLLSIGLTVLAIFFICVVCKHRTRRQVINLVFAVAIVVTVLEIYKQINFTFSFDGEKITADYLWFAFPWQFCSMPMYVGLLAGIIRKGKIHHALCAFLATYSIFAGVCVMLYPVTVFVDTIGINIQTMVCHGSMVVIGVYLLHTEYVKLEHKTILKAIPVFAVAVFMAMIMNELAYYSGILEEDDFNMFFISPHSDPSLPVYSLVQEVVPYPWCLVIYVVAFSLAAYLVLLTAMGIRKVYEISKKGVSNK